MMRRDELRDSALDYFLAHGLADLSLRPLAEAIGSSARLLMYHFVSRDNLIMVVMEEVRLRIQQSVIEMMNATRGKAGLEAIWHWATDPANLPYVRLLFEVQVLALQHPETYARYLAGSNTSWIEVIERGIPASVERRTVATLCGAVIDGLMLNYMSTGDLSEATAALQRFVVLLGRPHEA